jgi:GAF domain-containing protein
MLAFRLFARGHTLGALNLFSNERVAFGEEAEQIGVLFATLASTALGAAQREEDLATAGLGGRQVSTVPIGVPLQTPAPLLTNRRRSEGASIGARTSFPGKRGHLRASCF